VAGHHSEPSSETGETAQKPVGTREWYDFVGQLAGLIPTMHVGGHDSTQELLDLVGIQTSSRVLDVGCGSGVTACFVAETYGALVSGVDLSEVMIDRARERARRQGLADWIDLQVGDVFDLPFEDGYFDVVIVESVLMPLPGDKGQAMKEMVRVLKLGGRMGANEGTIDPAVPPVLEAKIAQHPAMYGTFTPDNLRRLFEEAGLRVIELVEGKGIGAPGPTPGIGLWGLASFMVRVYPKILIKLLREPRFRQASRIDAQVTKEAKPYMGYAVIVGQKEG
jgi:ubiquinone/menaquinone biosynthesis C-methylase UbiE